MYKILKSLKNLRIGEIGKKILGSTEPIEYSQLSNYLGVIIDLKTFLDCSC